MRRGWTEVALGEVVSHRTDFFEIDDLSDYMRCRVKLHAQGVELRDKAPGALIKTKRQQRCHASDFLVAEIDAKVGGYGLVPTFLDGAVVSSHYFLFKADPAFLLPEFLGFFARTRRFADQVKARGSTNYAAIRPSNVLGYSIPLPSLEDQRSVVAQISAIENRLHRVQALREEIRLNREALTTSLHFSLSQGRTVRLDQVLRLDEERRAVEPEGSYPQVGIRSFGLGLFKKPPVGGTETTYRSFNILRPGMFMMSQVKGWEGAIGVCGAEFDGWFVSPEYRTFTGVPGECDPAYLSHLVLTPWFRDQLAAATRGVGARRERVRPEMLLGLQMPFPTIEKQTKAAKILDQLRATHDLSGKSTMAETALLPSLLDQIFRG